MEFDNQWISIRDKPVDGYIKQLIQDYIYRLTSLKSVERFNDNQGEDFYTLGYYYLTIGLVSKAKEVFERLTNYLPGVQHYWRALGVVNQQLQLFKEAILAFDRDIDLGTDIVAYLYRAECFLIVGDKKKAIKDLETIVQVEYDISSIWLRNANKLLNIYKNS